MVWNDTMGSAPGAFSPAAREAEKKAKALQKQAQARAHARDQQELDDYKRRLVTLHHETVRPIDWDTIAARPEPVLPEIDTSRSGQMQAQLAQTEEGMIDRLVGRGRQTRAALEQALALALSREQREAAAKMQAYEAEHRKWATEQEVVRGIREDVDATILAVIRKYQTLSNILQLGREIGFSVRGGKVHAAVVAHDISVVPNFQFKMLPNGRMSEVKPPREVINRLYRGYVASAMFKVASDLFQLLPKDVVYVTTSAPLRLKEGEDPRDVPILSTQFTRAKFKALDMRRIDPAEAMKLFHHRHAYSRMQGFAPITPLLDQTSP